MIIVCRPDPEETRSVDQRPCLNFIAVLAPLAFVLATTSADTARAQGNERRAPAFTVRTLDGKPFRLEAQRGNPIILDFWATWCGPCRKSLPHLDALQERYSREGLVVIGLSVDEGSPATVRRFGERMGLKFRLAMADEKLLDLYGPIRLLPTTFFINRRGEIVRRTVGYLDAETLEEYVKQLF
jgi:thiol-disulfide isomerase/thioredoxin